MESNARGVTFGRYVLAERLGKGGMGEVYLAVQTGIGSFEKPMALKLLLPHLAMSMDAVQMFLTEARLAARMNHANVTQIFDVGFIDQRYFMAMELVQGVSLDKLIRALMLQGPPPLDLAMYVARALCDGLHHAHEQRGPDGRPLGLVHRDVTPHNVLISVDGAVKLADFGIARATEGKASSSDSEPMVGKLAYVAPEQMRGEVLDRRADVYAAALTVIHFATLKNPFRKADRDETVEAVLTGPLPQLKGLPPVLLKALQRRPGDRPATARELAEALPPPSAGAADRLGELVRQVCEKDVKGLVDKTNHALKMHKTGTAPLEGERSASRSERSDSGSDPEREAEATRRRLPLIIGAFVAAGVAGVLLTGALLTATRKTDTPGPSKPAVAAEAQEPAKPKAPAGVGYLTVDADPWATVFINERLQGETPLSKLPVESGRLTVELKNAETGRRVTRTVDVAPGQHAFVKESLR